MKVAFHGSNCTITLSNLRENTTKSHHIWIILDNEVFGSEKVFTLSLLRTSKREGPTRSNSCFQFHGSYAIINKLFDSISICACHVNVIKLVVCSNYLWELCHTTKSAMVAACGWRRGVSNTINEGGTFGLSHVCVESYVSLYWPAGSDEATICGFATDEGCFCRTFGQAIYKT
jgi:hypothetical protein